MLTTSCPKCEQEVTVPPSANADSRVRCPLCSEEYTLEHVFTELPPLLELLDLPASNGAVATDAETDAGTESATDAPEESAGMFDFDKGEVKDEDEGEGDIAMADPAETVPKSSGFDFGDSTSTSSTTGTATPTRKARPRKKGSPMKSIIGVVIGGLLAIPIAQLTLWWLIPGASIEQRDPMGLGQSLAGTAVQFIVPEWVRNPGGAEDNTAAVEPGTANPTSTPPAEVDDAEEPAEDYEEPGGLGSLLGQNGNNRNGNRRNRNNDGNGQNGNAGDGNNPDGSDVDGNSAVENPIDEPESNDGSDSGIGDQPPQPKSRIKNAPSFTASDLAAELKVVKPRVDQFAAVDDQDRSFPERKAICDEFMAAAGKLAEVTTFVDEKPDGHREHLNEILQDAANTPGKRRWIGISANLIIGDKERSANGIILAGEVTEINERGPTLHEAIIALDTKTRPPISVLGTSDPSQSFSVGEQVMILGMIVDKPADEITDYVGPRDEPVVWGGYSQVVPTLNEE